MELGDLAIFVLLGVVIIMAVVTAEVSELLYAALGLLGMCVSLGILYWLLFAPYVAVFQLAIYAGAVVVLFVSVIMLTRRDKENEQK